MQTQIKDLGLNQSEISNIQLDFKSGRKSVYYDVESFRTFKDELDIDWILLTFQSKSFEDRIYVPLMGIDNIHLTQQTNPVKSD